MAAPADYWDTFDLKALAAGGLVKEDVMAKIFDISKIPLPFTERIGSDMADNSYTEWTTDELADPDLTNAVVSGSDASGNDAAGGARVGNHCQNSVKVIAVTERAESTSQFGRDSEFAYQLMQRGDELRRDVEAIALSNQASVADNNNAVAGLAGGFPAWIETNRFGGAGGSAGGFNTTTKVVDAPTAGDSRGLTDLLIANAVEAVYLENGDITVAMSVPQLIRRIARYQFTSGANIAVPTAQVSGSSPVVQVANGFVNILVTDFGTTLELVPNRLMQVYDSGDSTPVDVCDLLLIDVGRVALGYLKNYVTRPLGKLGLSERSQISVDWTVKVYNEKAHGVIADILPTTAVAAS